MGIFRWKLNRGSRSVLCASLVAALAVTTGSAQSAEGKWGAEGRIGAGQSAYLLRWFNADWSLLLGGGVTSTSTENTAVNATNNVRTANLQALFRKEWGTGRVRPFFGIGPQFNISHSVNKSPSGGIISESTSDNLGLGGRGEFGAMASVGQSVGLGIVLGATGQRGEQKSKSSGSSIETKSTNNSFSIGNPQFVMRVRF